MTMFNARPGSGIGLALETFAVPTDLITARALFREMSSRVDPPLRETGVYPPFTLADRLKLAESFERYVLVDGDTSLQRARWIALEKGIRKASHEYVGWANLAREIAAEEVFLRTGCAQASSAVLEMSLDRFKDPHDVWGLLSGVFSDAIANRNDLRGGDGGGLNTGSLEGGLGDSASVGRGGNQFDHSESSVGCVVTATVGDGGQVGNGLPADTDQFSSSSLPT